MELQLKFLLYNTENLFLDGHIAFSAMKKPIEKTTAIAKIINDENPDVAMLLEVGGIESLEYFTKNFLNDKYLPMLLPGNSDRGIEMGYLIRKDLLLHFEIKSHKDLAIHYRFQDKIETSKFSRDISELKIFDNTKLKIIILLVHLKSKWDREGNDPGGALKRSAELNSLVEYYLELKKAYPTTPVMIAGDFNGSAQRSNCEPEFAPLYRLTDLEDVLETDYQGPEDRHTYYQFTREGKRFGYQLDYMFIPKELISKISKEKTGVYRYNLGVKKAFVPPASIFERASLPSDHYPVILHLDF
jgi:exonuclease III